MTEITKLDHKNKKIIKALFKNGRMTVTEIAKKTKLKRDSIARRIKKMQTQGILKLIPFINPKLIGLPNFALILFEVKINPIEDRTKFITMMKGNKYIFHFSKIIGKYDFYSVIAYRDTKHLNELIETIKRYVEGFIENLEVFQIAEEYKIENMSELL